jgi:hypothetical protein
MTALSLLIVLALVLTLGFLFTGVLSMFKGGEFNKKYGNRLMRGRVAVQAVAIGLIGLYWLLNGR